MTTDKAAAPVGCEYCGRSDCSADRHWQPIPPAAPVGAVPQGDAEILRQFFAGERNRVGDYWHPDTVRAVYERQLASQAARMGELEQDAARLDWLNDADNAMDAGIYGIPTAWAPGCSLRSRIDKLRGEAG